MFSSSLRLFVALFWFSLGVTAASAIALDGTPTSGTTHASTTCAPGSITTTGTNEIIVVIFGADNVNATGSAPSISSVSGNSLTWNRATVAGGVNYHSAIVGTAYIATEIWWALEPSATTVTPSATYSGTFDNCADIIAAFTSANTSTPLDTNVSLPANNGGSNTTGDPSTASVSTSCATDMIIQSAAYWNNSTTQADQTTGTGFSTVANRAAQTGTNFGKLSAQYGTFASTQTSQTFSFGTSWPGGLTVVEAIRDASATCSSAVVPKMSLLGVGP